MPPEPLDDDARRYLLALARRTLADYFAPGATAAPGPRPPAVERPGAAFVTLRERDTGRLRGCRGETRARRPLADSVAAGALASALDDPRFPPLAPEELDGLSLHISALGPMTPIDPEDVEVGRHGLLLTHPDGTGLLLPQVPRTYGLATREAYLDALARKAGLPANAWRDPRSHLLAFEAEDWGEK